MDFHSKAYTQQYCDTYPVSSSSYPAIDTNAIQCPTPVSHVDFSPFLDIHRRPLSAPTPPFVPAAVSWPGDLNTAQCFANVTSYPAEYQDIPIYGLTSQTTTGSPYISRHTMPSTAFLSPPPTVLKPIPQRRTMSPKHTETATRCSPLINTAGRKNEERTPSNPTKTKTRTSGKAECPTCGKLFTRSSNCKSHMKLHDPNRKYPYKCPMDECRKQFSRKTDMMRHVDSVHMKIRRYSCPICELRFTRQDTMRRHYEDGCKKQQHQNLNDAAAEFVAITSQVPYPQPSLPMSLPETEQQTLHLGLGNALVPSAYRNADQMRDFPPGYP